MTVCELDFLAGPGVQLKSGFVIGATLMSKYEIKWFKDGLLIPGAGAKPVTTGSLNYTATQLGTYRVEVTHIALDACQPYDTAWAEMTISAWPKSFDVIDTLKYCGDSAIVKVNSLNNKGVYNWYTTQTSSTIKGTTIGDGTAKINITGALNGTGTNKVMWVEEDGYVSGMVMKKAQACNTSWFQTTVDLGNALESGFYINEPVTIDSLSVPISIKSYNPNLTASGAVTVSVYGARINNGNEIADKANVIKSVTYNFSELIVNSNVDVNKIYRIPMGVNINTPGTYFISVSALSKIPTNLSADFKLGTGSCTQTVPVNDDSGFTIMQYALSSTNGNANTGLNLKQGHILAARFSTRQHYCNRFPVELIESCPCLNPAKFTKPIDITNTTVPPLCPVGNGSSTITLTTTTHDDVSQTGNEFEFAWYKGAATNISQVTALPVAQAFASGTSSTLAVNYADISTTTKYQIYTVLVRDKAEPSASNCWSIDTIRVKSAPAPTYTFTDPRTYCDSATSPVEINFTGTAPYTFVYRIDATDEPQVTSSLDPYIINKPKAGVYSMYTLKDAYCTATISNSITTTIVINPTPKTTWLAANKYTYCGTDYPNLGVNVVTGATYVWTGPKTSTTNVVNAATKGNYAVTVSKSGCNYVLDTTIVGNEVPDVTVTGGGKYCQGSKPTPITVTISGGSPSYTVDYNINGGANNPQIFTKNTDTLSKNTEGTYTITRVTDVNTTCFKDVSATGSISEIKLPVITQPAVQTAWCASHTTAIDVSTLFATAAAGTKTYSIVSGGGSISGSSFTHAGAGTYKIRFQIIENQNSCPMTSERDIVIYALPVIGIATTAKVCEGVNLTLNSAVTLGTTPYTYAWSGTGATYLNSNSAASPVFNSGTFNGATSVTLLVTDAAPVPTGGCTATKTVAITVDPKPVITLSADKTKMCSDAADAIITATEAKGLTGTGTWTSNVSKTSEMAATFDPSIGATGSPYEVKYNFTSAAGCIALEKTISLVVDPLPNVTITSSVAGACHIAPNADNITFTTAPTGGTGVFSVNNSGVINATTGVFDPKANLAGDYTVTYKYTDANQCKGEKTTLVKVYDLPIVSFTTNPTEVCYNSSAFNLSVSPTPSGTFAFTGTSSSNSAQFDPSTAAVGENNFTYTYTDINKCVNSASLKITVVDVDVPTVNQPNPKTVVKLTNNTLSGNTDLSATLGADNDNIQWMPVAGKSILQASGTTFSTGKTISDPEGTYPYAVRGAKNIAGGVCYSDSVIAQLVITNCPALTPSVEDPFYCLGSTQSLTALATKIAGSPGEKISWFTSDPVGKKGASIADLEDANLTHTAAITAAAIGTEVIYAAEYDADNDCWSAGKLVTITVVDTPNPTIDVPTDVCATSGKVIPTLDPPSGILSATGDVGGFNATERSWDPSGSTDILQTINLKYTVEASHGAGTGATTCIGIAAATVNAHFIDKPTGTKKSWMISDIDGIPDNFMVSALTSGVQNYWYEKADTSDTPVAGITFTPNRPALKAEVLASGETKLYIKQYYVVQIDAFGCRSEAHRIDLELVDCPFLAPNVDSIARCKGVAIPSLTAVPTTTEPVTAWRWLDSDMTTELGSSISLNTGVDKDVVQFKKFYVQYEAIEPISKNTCWSPTKEVTVMVVQTPQFTVNENNPKFCYPDASRVLDVTLASAYTSLGYGVKNENITVDNATYSGGLNINPKFWGETTKNHSLTYTVTDNIYGCIDSAVVPFSVQFTPPPVVVPNPIRALTTPTLGAPSPIINTTADGAATAINIYRPLNTLVGNGATWDTKLNPAVEITTNYFVTQVINGCESKPDTAIVELVNCPVMKPVLRDTSICEYDEAPVLTLVPQPFLAGYTRIGNSTFKWYKDANKVGLISSETTTSFDTENRLTKGASVYFYVTEVGEYEPGKTCESPAAVVKVSVPQVLPVILPTIAPVCEGTPFAQISLSVSEGDVLWIDGGTKPVISTTADALALINSAAITTGNYSPAGARAVGNHEFHAIKRVKGCLSSAVTATGKVVAIPVPPVVTVVDDRICQNTQSPNFNAVPLQQNDNSKANTIRWYLNATTGTGSIKDGVMLTTSISDPGTHRRYASQIDYTVLSGCESQTAYSEFVIVPLPAKPIITGPASVCEYENAPEFTVNPEGTNTIIWAKDGSVISSITGGAYTLSPFVPGTYVISAKQSTVPDGCVGPEASVTVKVGAKPAPPVFASTSIFYCFLDEQMKVNSNPVRITTGERIKWFTIKDDFNSRTTENVTATTYIPQVASMAVGKSYIYATQTTDLGCESDMAEKVYERLSEIKISIQPLYSCFANAPENTKEFFAEVNQPWDNNSKVIWMLNNVRLSDNDSDERTYTPKYSEMVKPTQEEILLTATSIKNTTYKVTYSYAGCEKDTTAIFGIVPTPIAPQTVSEGICIPKGTTDYSDIELPLLTAVSFGPSIVNWYDSTLAKVGEGREFDLKTIPNYESYLEQNTVRKFYLDRDVTIDLTSGGNITCRSNKTLALFEVGLQPVPEINDSRIKFCVEDYQRPFTIMKSDTANIYSWSITGNRRTYTLGAVDKNKSYILVDFDFSGIDTLVVQETILLKNTGGRCIGYDTLIITIAEKPKPEFDYTIPGAADRVQVINRTRQDSIIETVPFNHPSYPADSIIEVKYTSSWNFGKNEDTVDVKQTYLDRNNPIVSSGYIYGNYDIWLVVENDHGCKDSIAKEVFIDVFVGLYIPNAFAPTNPAIGVRTFQPKGYNLVTYECWIYDNWGNLVWYSDKLSETGEPSEGWDGTNNGELLKSDTYNWKIEASFKDGTDWEGIKDDDKLRKLGSVLLIR
ncbi:MAG: hypothetical protein IPO21_15460 [Bacteroidales bacterium]|nr:hypothetical protein [Bacteroidales bacterium]